MSYRRTPRRIEIQQQGIRKWYDVREGWAGKLEIYEYMKAPEFTANEPYMHINNLYFVYDTGGNKVGEIHTDNRTYSGVVTDFEA